MEAEATPIGWLPTPGDLDTTGLDIPADDLGQLLRVDTGAWAHAAMLGAPGGSG